jgi:hypothetical protein
MLIRLKRFWIAISGRDRPFDDRQWHHWQTIAPVRLVGGGWSAGAGQLWRRRSVSGWEYRQDEETDEAWWDRAW